MFRYNCKLIRVIDGDTVDAMIDLGFNIWIKKRIRLYGINTPEIRTKDLEEKKRGLQAKDKLVDILGESDGFFVLESHGVGKYGRCLGTLFTDNVNINNLLITEGHATHYL